MTMTERGRPRRRSPPPRHHARPVHGGLLLMVEVADEADELAQALDVEGVEVDLVAAAGSLGRPSAYRLRCFARRILIG